MQVQSLGWEDPLEQEMAPHSRILAWKIPWAEEPGRLYTVHGAAKSQTRLRTEHIKWSLRSLQKLGATEPWTHYKVNGHSPPRLFPTAAHTVTREPHSSTGAIQTASHQQMPRKLHKIQVPRKRSVFIPIPKKGNTKECSNYRTIALISHVIKIMFKTLQARLKQYMN